MEKKKKDALDMLKFKEQSCGCMLSVWTYPGSRARRPNVRDQSSRHACAEWKPRPVVTETQDLRPSS